MTHKQQTGKNKTQAFSNGELDEVGFDEQGDVIHAYELPERRRGTGVSASVFLSSSKKTTK